MKSRKWFHVAAIFAAVLAFGAGSATAGSTRVSRGDAEAVLHASIDGGRAILVHSGNVVGPAAFAPSDGVRFTAFVSGFHYCSLDWHVAAVSGFDGNATGETRTPDEIANALSAISIDLFIDGSQLDTVRTPVVPLLAPVPGFDNLYGFTVGRVIAPADLSVGAHTFTEVTSVGGATTSSQATFYIDGADTGACL
jgi:hypothetical protein